MSLLQLYENWYFQFKLWHFNFILPENQILPRLEFTKRTDSITKWAHINVGTMILTICCTLDEIINLCLRSSLLGKERNTSNRIRAALGAHMGQAYSCPETKGRCLAILLKFVQVPPLIHYVR